MIKHAMIFAAGIGVRMQPYTRTVPKPLVTINNKCLIDIVIDRLLEYGIEKIVVNCHYFADQVIKHLEGRPKITILYEKDILDTGGGLINALPTLGMDPIITINADTIWFEPDLLQQLTYLWNHLNEVEIAMTFYDSKRMLNHHGTCKVLQDNSVIKKTNGGYIYAGIQIINPILLSNIKKKVFSLSELYSFLFHSSSHTVHGTKYEGQLFHIGSPEELEFAQTNMPIN